jgi:DNA-binding NarL/FixJ family response regulator
MTSATADHAAATPSPAQVPIGTLSARGTVRWTARPAIIGESRWSHPRSGSASISEMIAGVSTMATCHIVDEIGAATRVLVLTTFDLDEYVYDALGAGASGFLLKDATADALFDAVRVVAAGDALLSPRVTRRPIGEFARLRPNPPVPPTALRELTPRETEVLRHIAEGLSNAEIAERLVVAEETVKTHVSHVLMKLGLRDRAQAVVVAYESGLVSPRPEP